MLFIWLIRCTDNLLRGWRRGGWLNYNNIIHNSHRWSIPTHVEEDNTNEQRPQNRILNKITSSHHSSSFIILIQHQQLHSTRFRRKKRRAKQSNALFSFHFLRSARALSNISAHTAVGVFRWKKAILSIFILARAHSNLPLLMLVGFNGTKYCKPKNHVVI